MIIFLTWPLRISVPMPNSSRPALFDTRVRFFAPCSLQRGEQVLGKAAHAEAADQDGRAVGDARDRFGGGGDGLVHAADSTKRRFESARVLKDFFRRHFAPVHPAPFPRRQALRVSRPIPERTSRSVGWPTAAVMRRTWRLRPSVSVISSQAVGTFSAEADRRVARREVRLGVEELHEAGKRAAVGELHAAAQLLERRVVGHALDLDPVRARMAFFRIGQTMVEPAVVGEQQQALAVVIEAARGIDSGRAG